MGARAARRHGAAPFRLSVRGGGIVPDEAGRALRRAHLRALRRPG